MYIKVLGMQRTGTNYFEQLIKLNIDAKPAFGNKWGWKHAHAYRDIVEWCRFNPHDPPDEPVKAVIMIKNPYTWYTSIKKWFDIHNLDSSVEAVFNRYNHLYTEHKHLLNKYFYNTVFDQSILVRYEDYLLDEEQEIKRVAHTFGAELSLPLKKPTTVANSPKPFTTAIKDYYIKQIPRYISDTKLLKQVTQAVDWDLMKYYNYYPI